MKKKTRKCKKLTRKESIRRSVLSELKRNLDTKDLKQLKREVAEVGFNVIYFNPYLQLTESALTSSEGFTRLVTLRELIWNIWNWIKRTFTVYVDISTSIERYTFYYDVDKSTKKIIPISAPKEGKRDIVCKMPIITITREAE
jgi:F0F1-type ATP synthase beta subunit